MWYSEFNIKGSVDDWNKMKNKIQRFREFDLDSWVNNLGHFIDNLIRIVNGEDNKSFLNSFYKFESTSGAQWITGEILRLLFIKELLIMMIRIIRALNLLE